MYNKRTSITATVPRLLENRMFYAVVEIRKSNRRTNILQTAVCAECIIISKLCECPIKAGIETELWKKSDLSEYQDRFCKGRSTIDVTGGQRKGD